MGKLSLNEQPIHTIVVQTMPEGLQLVIINNTYQRMQYWSIHKTSIVIRIVNLQNLLHLGSKDMQNNLIMVEKPTII